MPEGPVRASETRRTETPNAVMTTLASPSQGHSAQLSMWTVDMQEGQKGPLHVFDTEQIWHVLAGNVEIAIDDEPFSLYPGDTIVLAGGVRRQVSACGDVRLVVCGRGDAVVSVPGEATSRGVPPWIG